MNSSVYDIIWIFGFCPLGNVKLFISEMRYPRDDKNNDKKWDLNLNVGSKTQTMHGIVNFSSI
jgi:hypothetical protein